MIHQSQPQPHRIRHTMRRPVHALALLLGLPSLLLALLWATLGLWPTAVSAQTQPTFGDRYDLFENYRIPIQRAATAEDLAVAMDIDTRDLLSATVLSDNMDSAFAIIGRVPGTWFPTRSDHFLWLSTGDAFATTFHTPSAITVHNSNNITRTELRLDLHVPLDKNCANFDFAFYTRETYTNSIAGANDYFVAQLNQHTLSEPHAAGALPVNAPGNFALDLDQQMLTTQRVYAAPAVADPPSLNGSVSPLLRARVPVTPNVRATIYLTLRDVGDPYGDSAVAVDNFYWSEEQNCTPGQSGDRDGDGLPDGWERHGITLTIQGPDGTSSSYVDLPLIGADPDHRDIFVEIDHMDFAYPTSLDVLFDYAPDPTAVMTVVQAFANAPITNVDGTTGIHLHVAHDQALPLPWPGKAARDRAVATGKPVLWGTPGLGDHTLGDGSDIPFAEYILDCNNNGEQDWSNVDQLKLIGGKLTPARALVFHYAIWAHRLCEDSADSSGISRNWDDVPGLPDYFEWGASDFIVAAGLFYTTNASIARQRVEAGTFMHELGHNLGLMHGGSDHVKYKPNHLSVMNYLFQRTGLRRDQDDGYFDYARSGALTLTTTNLDERTGVYDLHEAGGIPLGTTFFCPPVRLPNGRLSWELTVVEEAWQPIDWNCNNEVSETVPVSVPILGDCKQRECPQVLTSVDEWDRLTYTGGLLRRDVNILSTEQPPRDLSTFLLAPIQPPMPERIPDHVPEAAPRSKLLPDRTRHEELDVKEPVLQPEYPKRYR